MQWLAHHSITPKPNTALHGRHARLPHIHALLPTTYMNRSGKAVQALVQYYKIAMADVLVVHDDIDLPCGAIRIKIGGGHGGHNGLRHIIATLGNAFARIRIGIGRPSQAHLPVDQFVLQPPTPEQSTLLDAAIDAAIAQMPTLLAKDFAHAQQVLHSR